MLKLNITLLLGIPHELPNFLTLTLLQGSFILYSLFLVASALPRLEMITGLAKVRDIFCRDV